MHCELVVPALFAAHEIPRLPSLELLLARGRAAHADRLSLEAWLLRNSAWTKARARRRDHGRGRRRRTDEHRRSWVRADPVHSAARWRSPDADPRRGLRDLARRGRALVETLNRRLRSRCAFVAVRADQWCMRASVDAALDAAPPAELAREEASLPGGTGCSALACVHENPDGAAQPSRKREREQRGAPLINSVWFWGAGRRPQAVHGRWHSLVADDALAAGFAQLAGTRIAPLPGERAEWLERAPLEGRHLVVLDALRSVLALGGPLSTQSGLPALEARWFAPLLEALRSEPRRHGERARVRQRPLL
jgi:hypothetical protein